MNITALNTTFEELFQSVPVQVFLAPGRINLIGEHTDYNRGHVCPCAITYGAYGVAKRRKDRLVRCTP